MEGGSVIHFPKDVKDLAEAYGYEVRFNAILGMEMLVKKEIKGVSYAQNNL